MKNILRRIISCLLIVPFVLFPASSVYSQDTTRDKIIERVEFKGNKSLGTSELLGRIRSKQGAEMSPATLQQDVQTLYDTGFFKDISVDLSEEDSKVIVVFLLKEKPALSEVVIEGNKKISKKKILKALDMDGKKVLDQSALTRGLEKVRRLYIDKGFEETHVEHSTEPSADGQSVVLKITINEGKKIRISKVIFNGAQKVSGKKLRKVMKTRGRNLLLFRLGKLDHDEFTDDLERVKLYYYSLGYIDAKITNVRYRYRGNRVIIELDIIEGEQYTVGNCSVSGIEKFPKEDLIKLITLKKGEIFLPPEFSTTAMAIRDYYQNKGYMDCYVDGKKNINPETRVIDIDFAVEENEISYINEIKIEGNPKTKDIVIRRELNVYPGEICNGVKVRTSERRIRNLQYFEEVNAVLEPTEDEQLKNLLIRVEEGSTGQINFGAGFSSIDKLLGFVEFSQNNFDIFNPPYFDGDGQKLKIRAQVGGTRNDITISFTEPWLFDRKILLGLDFYRRERDYYTSDYEEDRMGGSIKLGKPLTEFIRGYLIYRYETIDISPDKDAAPEIKLEEGRNDVSTWGLKFDFDTRNRVFFPSKGMHHILSGELAGLGGDIEYYKVEFEGNIYVAPLPMFPDVTMKFGAEVGMIEEYGDTDHIPIFERYFLGGPYSLRGFDYREVSPHGVDGSEIGGNFKWLGVAELLIPLVDMVRLALFFDVGNVYPTYDDAEFSEMSADVGVGLRLQLPIGPLSFDYGIPVKTDENTKDNNNPEFHFSVGGVF